MLSPKNAFAWLLLAIVLVSCKSNNNIPSEENQLDGSSTTKADSAAAGNNSPAANAKTDEQRIAVLVAEWNIAHNTKNFSSLKAMYADEVNLYGTIYAQEEAINHKKEYFVSKKHTYQQIVGGSDIKLHSPFVAKANFIKKVASGKSTNTYMAYLMLEKSGGEWKIVAESDEQADNERLAAKSAEISTTQITSCEQAAEALFRSSAIVKQMLNNPNTSYKLEYKPGDIKNPNNRFWYWVYANAANSSSTETYGRFQVDPQRGQLYELDLVSDKAILIESSTTYQAEVKKHCAAKP